MKSGTVVGTLEITFNLDLSYNYNSPNKIAHCYSVRKKNWINLLQIRNEISNHEDYIEKFKRKLLMDFMNKIYFPIKDFEEDL